MHNNHENYAGMIIKLLQKSGLTIRLIAEKTGLNTIDLYKISRQKWDSSSFYKFALLCQCYADLKKSKEEICNAS